MLGNVVVLGGSADQIPMIKAVRRRGYGAVIVDMSDSCPGRELATSFYQVSISDARAVEKIAMDVNAVAILSMISEAGVIAQLKASKILGLPCVYTEASATATHSKISMRKAFSASGILNIPHMKPSDYFSLEKFFYENNEDIVVKQSQTGGQKGLIRVRSIRHLSATWGQLDTNEPLIVERFIHGAEVNCVYTVFEGHVKDLIVSDRVEQPGAFGVVREHVYPSSLGEQVESEIFKICTEINKVLQIHEGVVFPQFLIDGSGDIWTIELGVRIPGGLMDRLFFYATGIDLVELSLDQALGLASDYEKYRTGTANDYIRVAFLNGPPGPLNVGSVAHIKSSAIKAVSGRILEHGLFGQKIPAKISRLDSGAARFYGVISTGDSHGTTASAIEHFYSGIDFIDCNGKSLKIKPEFYHDF